MLARFFKHITRLCHGQFRARFTAGSLVIILSENDELLLVRNRYRERAGFSLPGGFMRQDERPAETVQRELREEVGLVLPVQAFIPIATYEQPWALHVDNLFACRINRFALGRPSRLNEVRAVTWMPLSNLPQLNLNRGAASALHTFQLWRRSHPGEPAQTLPDGVRYESNEKVFPQYQVLRAFVALIAFVCAFGSADILAQDHWFAGRRVLVGCTFGWLAATATAFYIVLSFSVYTNNISPRPPHKPRADSKALAAKTHAMTKQLHDGQFAMIIGLLTQPSAYLDRITESVSPGVTESTIHANFTIRLPSSACGSVLLLPLYHQWRGYLTDGLRFFTAHNERLSTASQETGIVVLAAVLRRLLLNAAPSCLPDYIRYTEPDVIAYLASDTPQNLRSATALIDRITIHLPAGEDANYVGALLKSVRWRYPIMVFVGCSSGLHRGALDHRLRVRMESRVIPYLLRAKQPIFAAWMLHQRDRLRRIFGIRPVIFSVPLTNAARCASYHLEVRGPRGSYLGRQRIAEYPSGSTVVLRDAEYKMRMRQGQSYSHLYIRHGRGFERYFFENHFYERSPGSIAEACLPAAGAAVLIWFSAFVRLSHRQLDVSPELVAILLAFPAVIGVIAGTGVVGRRVVALGARISGLVTVSVSLAASGYLFFGPAGSTSQASLIARPGAPLWLFLATVASLNVFACIVSWALHGSVEGYFRKRIPLPSDFDIDKRDGDS
jgi:ADP-ribose pyrophosphatase YjhB (NUDIX family)